MQLQDQLIDAFERFALELTDGAIPVARERELVSLFAFGPLLSVTRRGAPLHDPRQIGIEVAIPQRASRAGERLKRDVCKDLVIWEEPARTTWGPTGEERLFPLAVIEWKARTPTTGDRAAAAAAAADCRELAMWLSEPGNPAEAYSILVTGRADDRRVELRRVHRSGAPVVVFDSASPGSRRRGKAATIKPRRRRAP